MIITCFYEHEVLRSINNDSNADFSFNGWEPLHLFFKSDNFIRKKDLVLVKKGQAWNKARLAVPQNIIAKRLGQDIRPN